ncbi:YacL family protein [Ferrimonas balearica]|uniref:YacL family protein n=1 Tax=Ferrimonas balearica TaxID=44012 RepID=UPI001C990F86|nr:YacL family protein [Ferrimonas balearica]MBY5922418.1 YacL family protein [Ferrimonas balearica]MBY5995402.1 YacL family protein [Ferrimonas balearica]
MEYEFRRELGGQPLVLMSMGHEALGRYLTEECQEAEALMRLRNALAQIRHGQCREWVLNGAEQSLLITVDAVQVRDHALGQMNGVDMDPDLDYYDAESEAVCGLEDFELLLDSWQAFLAGR